MKHNHNRLTILTVTLLAVCLCVFLSACGKGGEKAQTHKVTEALDKAISDAIINEHKSKYYEGECPAEGHIILGADEKDEKVTVYLLYDFSYYGFENENFVAISGAASSAVMSFKYNKESGEYTFVKAEYPSDGTQYEPSVKELFPKKYQERIINYHSYSDDRENIEAQCNTYAKAYLEKIGRKAEIGEYGDFKYTLLSSMGVSTEVSNKLTEVYAKNGIAFPYYIGTFERIEKSVRYIYKTSYLESTGNILYTKEEYGKNKIVEMYLLDGKSGDLLDKYTEKEPVMFFDAKVLEVHEKFLLVKPSDDSDEIESSNKIEVIFHETAKYPLKDFYPGTKVRIVYEGAIAESYLAQINGALAVFSYDEISYYGGESPYAETELTTATMPETAN